MVHISLKKRPLSDDSERNLKRPLLLVLLLLAVLGAVFVAMSLGLPDITLLSAFGTNPPDGALSILLDVRLPRVLLALIAGAGLAMAGAGAQAVLCNPLVSPSILGVSSGAAFGAALAIFLQHSLHTALPSSVLMGAAFCSAILAVSLTYALASVYRASQETIILAGVAVSFIFSGCTAMLQYLAPWQDLRAIIFWSMGSLWSAEPEQLPFLGATVLTGGVLLMAMAKSFNALAMGEENAAAVGVNVKMVRLATLCLVSLLCATIISVTGAIGFIGLVAPHMARSAFGTDNKWLLPGSLLTGALLLLVTDTLARMLTWPRKFPLA